MEEVEAALKMVMSDYPEFSEFEDKILQSISDESGPITPEQLMEIISDYNIIEVSVQ